MDVTTLTGNLLAEWTLDVVRLEPGSTHRAETMSFQVGGKGVNVARALRHLGVESEAVGFAGGPMADLCTRWLQDHQVAHRWYPLDKGVRPGVVVRQTGYPDLPETTFLGMDLAVSAASWESALSDIANSGTQWLALCGSVPGWNRSFEKALQEHILSNGIQLCIDTYGPPLEDLVNLPVELVKINRQELERLLPEMAGAGSLDLLAAASEDSPVRNWIITDGPHPVLAAFETGEVYEIRPAPIAEASPTGSGDTFLAALLQQSLAGAGPEEMLRYASACATANAASKGIADFPLDSLGNYQPEIVRLG